MKKLLLISAISFCLLFTTAPAIAGLNLGGDLTKKAAEKAGYSGATDVKTFAATLGTVVKAALSLVGVLFMALMVYAGYLWMTARGDEPRIEKAQEMIRAAIIGLIIVLGAYSITNFVVPKVLERATGQSGGGTAVGG